MVVDNLVDIILYSRRAAGQINICNNILHYCELMVFSPVMGEFSPPASSSGSGQNV